MELNMTPRDFASLRLGRVAAATLMSALILAAAASPAAAKPRFSVNADGDACTVRTGVPGKENGLECCAVADPKDCVVILKPFPGVMLQRR
jgi:hypothetical protein